MRYSQIRAFHHVATCGGFSRAADALSLTQPAVSEQVRKLETDNDVLLFNRDRKQVTLTPVGEQLLACTRKFFEVEDQIAEVLSSHRAALDGRLRIIADSAFHLTGRLEAYAKRHPGVFISIRTGNTSEIVAALRSYDAEIGVVGRTNPGPDMEIRDLGASPIIAFAARRCYPSLPETMTLAQLARYPLVFREAGSRTRYKLEEAAARQGVALEPAIEVEGREAVQAVVAAGAGVGFVSEAEFGHDSRLARIAVKGAEIAMSESLICLRQRSDVRIIRSFMDIIPPATSGAATIA
ncbi:LysR family transcriptional regulator [Roseovarius spongiae]|uniref:LysR family transcriptional regulator n=1 Tax=Roseovarius spongiae TaxID=2320272 RepID=A0A3A8B4Q0_9RHOB|nr:LysR substrate-binding domain-containing protein [Roseovarius spongiae]RKF16781.1 LysR family transcriptional regulator [Roseovarius spongiae]